MYKSNELYEPTTFDLTGTHYTADAGQAITTMHCNQKDAKWKREAVIARVIPVEARVMRELVTASRSWEKRQAQKELETRPHKFYHAYQMRDGKWAIDAKVDTETWEVITCDHVTTLAPRFSSALKRYGYYKTYSRVYNSAILINKIAEM